jgi:MscS family membrane protein
MLVQVVLTRLGEAVIRSRRLRPGTIDTQVVRLGFRIVSVLVIAWMVIQGADSMGFSVAPLIAGLGVGGLAVALAAQHTIENFIAGLVLFADKPVRIGDSCQFGEQRGTVEQIGLRSTRIRGLDRTVISIPNSEFAKLRLVNYTRRDKILLRPIGISIRLRRGGRRIPATPPRPRVGEIRGSRRSAETRGGRRTGRR